MKKRLLSLLLCAMSVLAVHSEVAYILNEGFESGIPATWTQQVMSAATQNWVAENSDLTYPNGAFEGTGRVALRNTTGSTQDFKTRLITPVLNLPYGSQYTLKFAYAAAAWSGSVDSLTVYYSTDGTKWQVHTGFGSAQNQWKEVSLDLIGNGATYQLAFEAYDRMGRGVVLDAVRVFAKSACADIENFAADPHSQSVELSWTGDFGAMFQLIVDSVSHPLAELDPAGQYLHYEATDNDMVTVSGLLPEHKYYAYVRSLCSDNETGFTEWQSLTFTTAIGFPYIADFSTQIPANWQRMYGSLSDAFAGTNPTTTTSYWYWTSNTSVTGKAHVYGYVNYNYVSSWLVSPSIDLSDVEPGTMGELTFRLGISNSSSSATDISSSYQSSSFLHVLFSTDGGETWTEANQQTFPGTVYKSAMQRVRININEFIGTTSSLCFAFVTQSTTTSAYFHIDDVKLQAVDPACAGLANLAVNFTDVSASASWTVNGSNNNAVIQLSNSNLFPATSLLVNDTIAANSFDFANLTGNTKYYVRVKQICDDADWLTSDFTTAKSLPFAPANPTSSSFPTSEGWSRYYTTTAADVFDGKSKLTSTSTSGWSTKSIAALGEYVYYFNVYSTNKAWMVSPAFYVNMAPGEVGEIAFEYAFAKYGSYGTPADLKDTDDEFIFMISEDGGATWLRQNAQIWNCVDTVSPGFGAQHDLRQEDGLMHRVSIDLAQYNGKSIRIAFYGASYVAGSDNELDVRNVVVEKYDPNCRGLKNLKANVGITDVKLTWTVGGIYNNAKVQVSSNKNFTDTVAYLEVNNADSVVISGLTAQTTYFVRAIQNCGSFTWADAESLNFTTHCEAVSIPYLMGFEDETTGADPSCWTVWREKGTYPVVAKGTSYAKNGTMYLDYGHSSSSDYSRGKTCVALPEFTQAVNTLEMSFWMKTNSSSCSEKVQIGVMTNPLDTATFVKLAEFTPTTTYTEYIVGLNEYTGTGKYVAIRSMAKGYYGFVIDSIEVRNLPTCYRMGEVTVANETAHGATVRFFPTNTDTYEIIVADQEINPDSVAMAAVASHVVYTAVGVHADGEWILDEPAALHANTPYYIYVRGVCSDTEKGEWSKAASLRTQCSAYTPAEFGVETFSSANNFQCWTTGFTTVGSSTYSAYARRTSISKFGNVIQLCKEYANSSSTTYSDGAYAISPEFAVGDSINKFQIVFSAATNNASASNLKKLVVAIVASPSDLSSLIPVQTLTLPYATDSTGMKEFAVSFENYAGDYLGNKGRYVMFQSVAGADSTNYVLIDNVRLELIPTCKKVNEASISDITSEGGLYQWEDVDAAQYEVLVATVATKAVDTIAAPVFRQVVNNATSLAITGLEGNTMYYAYVRAICAAGDSAVWSAHTAFRTECAAISTLPWSEGFENMALGSSSSAAPLCWSLINANDGNYPYIYVNNSSTYVKSGSKSLYFQSSSSRRGYAVLPPFEQPINELVLSFACKFESTSSSGKLFVGYVTDASDAATFDTIVEVTRMTTWQNIKLDFTSVPAAKAAGARIAFMYGLSPYQNYYLGIDDIVVEALPACLDPKNLTVDSITENSARVHWSGSSAQYEFILKKGDAVVDSLILNDTVYHLTNLESGTTYNYTLSLRGLCSADSSDVVSQALTFNTVCNVKSLPHANDFEMYQPGVFTGACWTNTRVKDGTGSGTLSLFSISSSYANGGKQSLQLPDMPKGSITHLASPEFDIPAGEPTELSIDIYRNASGTSSTTEGVRLFALNGTDSVELGFLYRNYTQTDGRVVIAEKAAGWYTYVFTLPDTISGITRILLQGESQYGSATYLDNFKLRLVPTCFPGSNLHVVDTLATLNSVGFAWTPNSADNLNAHVIVKNGQKILADSLINGTVFVLNGLEASRRYTFDVEVYTVCGDVESADALVASLMLDTKCEAVSQLPWSESFEDYTSGNLNLPCWSNLHTAGTSTSVFSVSTSYYSDGSKSIYAPYMASTNRALLVLPAMQIDAADTYGFSLDAYRNTNSTSYEREGVRVYASHTDTIDASAVELGYLYRNYLQTDGDVVVAETATGWYRYEFSIPMSGVVYLLLQDESQNGNYFYLDNFKVRRLPDCKKVKRLVADSVFAEAVELTFSNVNAAHYQVVITDKQIGIDTLANVPAARIAADTLVADTTVLIGGLHDATTYYAYVRAVCSDSENGDWSPMATFTTECNAKPVPFAEDFSGSYPSYSLPLCWTAVKKSGNYPYVSSSGYLYMYGGGSTSSMMVALPEMAEDLNALTLSMHYKASVSIDYTTYGKLIVGTLSSLNESSFVALDTLDQADASTAYELILDAAPANAKYLAIRYALGTSSGYGYVYDIALTKTPSCLPLKSLEATNVERRSMDIVLTPKRPAAAYDLVISTVALTDSALNVAEKITIDTTVYHVDGLTRNTLYYIYARTNCGAEDYSEWTKISKKTPNLGPDCSESTPADVLTSGTGTQYAPISSFYKNSYVEQIYTADELHDAGLSAGYVSKVAFQWILASSYTKTVSLYVGTTDDSQVSVSDGFYLPAQVSEEVSVTFNTANKWYEFELTTPIYWDGSSNLVVGVLAMGTNYWSSGTNGFAGGTTDNNTVLYRRSDSENPLISTSSSLYATSSRADIRLSVCPLAMACPTVATVSHELLGDGISSARIAWTASTGDYANSYSIVYADSLITDWTNIDPQIDSIQVLDTVISGLEAYTDYYVYVIAHCDAEGMNDGSSQWSEAYRFKTASACPVITDLVFDATDKNSALATWSAPYADKNFVYVLADSVMTADQLAAATPVAVTDTFVAFTDLELTTTYHLYVAHDCGAGELSPYISATITTSAACPAVADLHVVTSAWNYQTISWSHDRFGLESEWEVGIVGRESVAQHVFDTTATLIGLEGDMLYTIYVKAVCGEGEESAAATLAIHTPEQPTSGNAIADGTATNSYIPVYGNFCDDPQKTQSIYSASMLQQYVGATITGLQYFVSSGSSANWENGIFTVSMGITSASTMGSGFLNEAVTPVYTGTLSASVANGMTITFDQPFVYTGGNLLIQFELPVETGYTSCSFVGATQSQNVSRYEYESSSYGWTGSTNAFLPKVVFQMDMQLCPSATNLKASNVTTTSAMVSWFPGGSETSWDFYCSATALTEAQLDAVTPVTLSYKMDTVLTGLLPDHDYFVYVRSLCSASESSSWKVLPFTTLPTCVAPVELKDTLVTSNSAMLRWTNLTEDFAGTYSVAVGKAATFNLAADSTYTLYENVEADSLVVTGLAGNTLYSFAVKGACSATDSSRWSAVHSFRTECAVVSTFPWTDGFETYATGNFNEYCWSNLHTAGTSTSVFYVSTTYAASGSKSIYAPYMASTNRALLVLPAMQIDDAGAYGFSLDAYRNTSSTSYEREGVRVYASHTDTIDASAVELGYLYRNYEKTDGKVVTAETATGWYRYEFSIPMSGVVYILLQDESQNGGYFYLDNFRVRALPQCATPVVAPVDAGLDTAFVSWTGNAASYIFEYSQNASFVSADTVKTMDTCVVLRNLSSNKTYYVRVTGVCDDGKSDVSKTVSFLTKVGLPFMEDFQASTSMPAGWTRWSGNLNNLSSSTSAWYVGTYGYAGFTPNFAYSSVSSSRYLLATPAVLMNARPGYAVELTFDVALSSYSGDTLAASVTRNREFSVVVSTDGGNNWTRVASWMNNGTMGDFASLPVSAAEVAVNLSDYVGQNIMVGFYHNYGTSSSSTSSYIRIDNVSIHEFNPNCLGVDSVKVSDITFAGATVDWQYKGGQHDAFIALSKSDVFNADNLILSDTVRNDSTYRLPALEPTTNYYVFVQQLCADNETSSMSSASFRSPYGVRFAPVFPSTDSENSSDWMSATGTAEQVLQGGSNLNKLSGWSLTNASTALNAIHFKANVYGSSAKHWLVSPAIDMSPNALDGLQFSFEAALTHYNNVDTLYGDCADDRMVVLACVDDTVWTKIAEWNNSDTADYRYDALGLTPTSFQFDLTEFGGHKNVRFAFYGESTVSGADNDLHVGKFVIDRTTATVLTADVCEGDDYDGSVDGNAFYIHASEYKVGENRFTKMVDGTNYILILTVRKGGLYEYSRTVCEGETYADEVFDLGVVTLQTNRDQMNRQLHTAFGCDSTIILHLTINPKLRVDINAKLCPGSEIEWNGQKITNIGNYTYQTTSVVTGCDSTTVLHVTWDTPEEDSRVMLLCAGGEYVFSDGTVITKPDNYTEISVKASGCDSTIYWHVVAPAADGIFYDEVFVKDLPYIVGDKVVAPIGTAPCTLPATTVETSCGEGQLILTIRDNEDGFESIHDTDDVQKLIIDNHLYIIRNGVIYSVHGARVN